MPVCPVPALVDSYFTSCVQVPERDLVLASKDRSVRGLESLDELAPTSQSGLGVGWCLSTHKVEFSVKVYEQDIDFH